ncbi:MAG: nucleotidyltransferase domain-containing protein [Candidatus Liptonbacteria bacterium]|nr:nucleotidyltransferase domain-containing protein [Candidatus Liptonbacteria bacterium]
MDKEAIIKEVKKVVATHLSKEYRMVLFGSWAKGDALETSDIDIGILGRKEVPWGVMVKILEEVENIPTLRKVDVVDLNSVSGDFRNNVLEYAKNLS